MNFFMFLLKHSWTIQELKSKIVLFKPKQGMKRNPLRFSTGQVFFTENLNFFLCKPEMKRCSNKFDCKYKTIKYSQERGIRGRCVRVFQYERVIPLFPDCTFTIICCSIFLNRFSVTVSSFVEDFAQENINNIARNKKGTNNFSGKYVR